MLASAGASLSFCVLTIATLSVFFYIAITERDFFAPPFFLFLYILFGTLDVIFVALGVRNVYAQHTIEIYQKSLGLIFLWLLAFLIAYRLASPRLSNVKPGKDSAEYVFAPLVILLVAIFAYSVASALRASFSLGGLVQGMLNGGAAFEDQGYLMVFLALCGIVPVIFLSKGKFKTGVCFAVILFFGVALTGRRSLAIFSAIVPCVIYWHYKVKRLNMRTLFYLAVGVVLFVLVLGAIRTSVETVADSSDSSILGTLANFTKYIGYGTNLPDLVFAIDSGSIEFQGFSYALRGLEYFIPRSIWPDKPLVHSSEITSNMIYFSGDVGRPTGPFGWAYFCFGLPGVILSGLITGLLCKYFYCYAMKKGDALTLALYSLLIMSVLDIFTPEAEMKVLLFVAFTVLTKFVIRRSKGRKTLQSKADVLIGVTRSKCIL